MSRDQNIKIWDALYERNEGALAYPNDTLVRVVHRTLDLQKHRKVLDYGFGAGSNMVHLIQRGHEMYGVEASAVATRKLNDRLAASGLSANLKSTIDSTIPFEDNQFDAVVAWEVLSYNDWSTLSQAVREIERVLKPGGTFLGTITAVGDFSQTHSISLGDGLCQSTVPGQEGCTVICIEEDQLGRCFPGRNLTTGYTSFQFGERHSKVWIVSFEK
jgi:cyclopropane fatty-acyl-phospholipid synthase-like methyltransferase